MSETRLNFSHYVRGEDALEVTDKANQWVSSLEGGFDLTSKSINVYCPKVDEGEDEVWVAHVTAEGGV